MKLVEEKKAEEEKEEEAGSTVMVNNIKGFATGQRDKVMDMGLGRLVRGHWTRWGGGWVDTGGRYRHVGGQEGMVEVCYGYKSRRSFHFSES